MSHHCVELNENKLKRNVCFRYENIYWLTTDFILYRLATQNDKRKEQITHKIHSEGFLVL